MKLPDGATSRGFEALHVRSTIDRPDRGGRMDWFKQLNARDCGPCMLANLGSWLHQNFGGPTQIREEARAARSALQAHDWFHASDVCSFLERKRFDVDQRGAHNQAHFDQNGIMEWMNASLNQGKFICSTSGSHWRAVVQKNGDRYLVFDSFQEQPIWKNSAELRQMLLPNDDNTRTEVYFAASLLREESRPKFRILMPAENQSSESHNFRFRISGRTS